METWIFFIAFQYEKILNKSTRGLKCKEINQQELCGVICFYGEPTKLSFNYYQVPTLSVAMKRSVMLNIIIVMLFIKLIVLHRIK